MSLIQRLEQLTGPDREVDAEIYASLQPKHLVYKDDEGLWVASRYTMELCPDGSEHEIDVWERSKEWCEKAVLCYGLAVDDAPAYTASIDAAITLVPDGWEYILSGPNGKNRLQRYYANVSNNGSCSSPSFVADVYPSNQAIALCIAALKARGVK